MNSSKDKILVPNGTKFQLFFDLEELSVLEMVFSTRFQDDFSRAFVCKARLILDQYDYPVYNG